VEGFFFLYGVFCNCIFTLSVSLVVKLGVRCNLLALEAGTAERAGDGLGPTALAVSRQLANLQLLLTVCQTTQPPITIHHHNSKHYSQSHATCEARPEVSAQNSGVPQTYQPQLALEFRVHLERLDVEELPAFARDTRCQARGHSEPRQTANKGARTCMKQFDVLGHR
jgi:hypothetical protein